MLTNHDQNLEFRFRLLKVCLLWSWNRVIAENYCSLSTRLDRSKIRLNWSKLVQIFFYVDFSNSAQAHMTYRVLCFALSIKGKTLATFCYCCLCYVYESLVRSRSVCLHTLLRVIKIKIDVESLVIVLVAT